MTKFAFVFITVLLPGIVNAQFSYTVNNNAVTITAYTGPGGAVDIPSTIAGLPVVNIQHWSFDPYYTGNSASVTSIAIPDSVTNIDYEAFEFCDTTNVTFGAGVISIGYEAFTSCNSLIAITADSNNPAFRTVDGVLFNKNQTTLIQCPMKAVVGSFTIPDSVTNIGDKAFFECAGLTNVTIGNGVISIGAGAFGYCMGLTSLIIPDGVTTISGAFATSGAFEYCTGLTNVTIGRGVTTIGNYTFYYCPGLINVSIPTNVSSVGSGAFYSCTSLLAISIPGSVTNIGDDAFYICTHLGSITIPGSVIAIGTSAFYSCLGLTNLTIGNGVKNIGSGAFTSCVGLTSVTIPQSVISIGAGSFSGCSGMTAITVDADNLSYSSADGVLFNKNQTVVVEWPSGRGGSYTLPNSVTNIGASAFQSCIALTNITVDAGVTAIGIHAFVGCTSLTALYFDGSSPAGAAGAFEGGSRAIAYYLPGTTGWSAIFAGIPTALWKPLILTFDPSFGVRTNNFGFIISWAPNTQVVVEACTNLASPVWSSLATLTLAGGSAYFSDAQWTNYPDRFYRLSSP
jgi:hypothetical protein